MTSARGFKVTDAERKTRVGIAVKTLEELRKKTVEKFKLKYPPSTIDFQMQDGTVIDSEEYFQTLPSQTLLIWIRKGVKAETDAEMLYKIIREVNDEYLTTGEKIQDFFTEKMKNKIFKLAEVLRGISGDKIKLSTRSEDPEWFEGLDTTIKTKEAYLRRRAQDRIRSYYYKTKEEIMKVATTGESNVLLKVLLDEFSNRLRYYSYHGYYFDRTCGRFEHMMSICDSDGTFTCQGRWDKTACLYTPPHSINPYASREHRIIFQTWNLDHRKERTRSVIPAIWEALQICSKDHDCVDCLENHKVKKSGLDKLLAIDKIYNDLFTTVNLKLVHIVCHDKGAHKQKAGPYWEFGYDEVSG
nr:unnamed protein product [Callosobruchus chinensis]